MDESTKQRERAMDYLPPMVNIGAITNSKSIHLLLRHVKGRVGHAHGFEDPVLEELIQRRTRDRLHQVPQDVCGHAVVPPRPRLEKEGGVDVVEDGPYDDFLARALRASQG